MKNKFEKIFEQLADFHTLARYDGWMIGACVYEQREAGKQDCKSEIVKKTSSFAVMRNQLEREGILYQLELHVVKPEVQETDTSRQAGIEENSDIGVGKTISFTHPDILRFVDAVGDTNSIHRTSHAVVPGLLMVGWMLGNLLEIGNLAEPLEAMKLKCRFRFEKPVFVDEKLQVQARTERGKQIYECKREDKEIVWNMRIL